MRRVLYRFTSKGQDACRFGRHRLTAECFGLGDEKAWRLGMAGQRQISQPFLRPLDDPFQGGRALLGLDCAIERGGRLERIEARCSQQFDQQCIEQLSLIALRQVERQQGRAAGKGQPLSCVCDPLGIQPLPGTLCRRERDRLHLASAADRRQQALWFV